MSDTPYTIEELAKQFLAIARGKMTGTLRIHAEDDRKKQFFFQQGSLADIDTGRPDTLLEAALRDSEAIGEKEVKRARKSMTRSEQTLGAALLEMGLVPEADVAENIRHRLTEEVCEVFEWPLESAEFFEHQADERLETFFSELTDFYEALADPEEVFLEAARRLERWDLVQEHFDVLRDVFYATPTAFRYFREQAKFPSEYAIVSAVDGIKDAKELISGSRLDPFLAVNLLRKLRAAGELELINPVQMYQLGVEFAGSGKFEKACKLFLRARERGLDDFDILYKLAQALDSLGHVENAVERYKEFGEKCLAQDRFEDAGRSFKRAIKLDPSCVEAHEKHLELLLQQNRHAEAAEQAIVLADLKVVYKDPRGALEVLLRARAPNPRHLQLQQKIIELAEATRNFDLARKEREELTRRTDQRRDAESELEAYQRRFCEGDDSLDVRIKLAELHLARGNRQKALDHINSILNLPDKYKVKEEGTLLLLHEAVREMKPADLRSNRWLAEYHGKKGDKAKAVAVLTAWIASLEREGDTEETVHVYEKLLAVDDSHEHRWGLAMALDKVGRVNDSRRELRSLANLALRKKEFEQAAKALEFILKAAPLDLETRKMQADLLEAKEEKTLAGKKHEEIALLAMLAGNVQEAELYCRRLPAEHPQTAEVVRRLGNLCFEQGDQQKGLEQIRKAAKLHLEQKNFGLSKLAIQEMLAIAPANPDAAALLMELKAREAPPLQPAPAAAGAPAPAASAAKPAVAAAAAAAAPAAAAAIDPAVHVAARSATVLPEPEAPPAPEPVKEEKPASAHLVYEREPFQPAAPVVTRVAGITAKLKRLKTAPATEPTQLRSVQVQVKDITSKLKSVKDTDAGGVPTRGSGVPPEAVSEGGADAPPAEPAAAGAPEGAEERLATASAESTKTTGPAALKSAASRLKALAGKKAQEVTVDASPAEGEPETEPDAAAAAAPPKKLGNVASKLAGLRKGDGAKATAPPADAATTPPAGKKPGSVVIRIPLVGAAQNTAAPGSLSDDQAARIAQSASAGEVKKAKLNTSASKLAALRKQKA